MPYENILNVPGMAMIDTSALVQNLKKVKADFHLSIQQIEQLIKANGDYVSERTLRRVFANNAEGHRFRYEFTLKPIARVLLYTKNADGNEDEIVKSLKSIIQIKNEEIEILQEYLDGLKAEYQRRVDFLRTQIDLKDKRMDEKDEMIKKLMDRVLG